MGRVNHAEDQRRLGPGAAGRLATGAHTRALAGALLAVAAVSEALIRGGATQASPQLTLALCLLAAATTLPAGLLPPTSAAVTTCVAALVSLALFHSLTVAGTAATVLALGLLGRTEWPRREVFALMGLLPVPFLILVILGSRPAGTEAGVLTVALAALGPAAVWSGATLQARREARAQSAARREMAGTIVEHSARGERARIARELHDVVAHHISMVSVQAEAARLTTPGMPAAGAQRLSAIGDTARAALTEMRRLLGVLREDARDGFSGVADRRPQPGIAQLNELLDAAREASGTGVRLILTGAPLPMDPSVELAAYRIAQEALTNARRHAPGAAVDVELTYASDGLDLRVRDNGPGPSDPPPDGQPGAGLGLRGMAERAAAVGGELRTGPAVGGGFLVVARLPATTGAP